MRVSPIIAAGAASAPVCRNTCGADTRNGARSGSPCSAACPPIAESVRSFAGRSTAGPSAPKQHLHDARIHRTEVVERDAVGAQQPRWRRLEHNVRTGDELQQAGAPA